jgi:coenzyme Q-binding protein COQ10
MKRARLARWVAFSPQQLFPIIARVEDYDQFLPLCSRSRVWDRNLGSDGIERFQAELAIDYPKLGIHELLTSSVLADSRRLTVTASSRQPPVKHLECLWSLRASRGGTEIDMVLECELASRTLQLLLHGLFDFALRKVMAAFEGRARHQLQAQPSEAIPPS